MNQKFLVAWATLDWLTQIRLKKIMSIYKDLEEAWKNIDIHDLKTIGEGEKKIGDFFNKKQKIILENEEEKLQKCNINLLFIQDEEYPEKLKEIHSAPVFLYYKGILNKNELALAVVGTRKITAYGKQVCEKIIPELSRKLTIVSGLALGVDTLAHNICLQSGGRTIAVLGNGLDISYPPQNRSLAEKIIESGGALVSEFPIGVSPENYNFPRRNRIISGLSLGTLIIEGKKESGSLITGRYALEQNREVFAVPGSILSTQSEGTNELIQKGEAKPVTCAQDIFDEISLENQINYNNAKKVLSFSSAEEELIFSFLSQEGHDISQIQHETNIPNSKISALLTMMEMKGIAQNIGSGIWVRKN